MLHRTSRAVNAPPAFSVAPSVAKQHARSRKKEHPKNAQTSALATRSALNVMAPSSPEAS